MTDVDLGDIEARLQAAEAPASRNTLWGLGEKQNAALQLQQHAPTDLRRLLDEVQRLKAKLSETVLAVAAPAVQLAEIGAMVGYPDPSRIAETVRAERDAARSECAALTAKVKAAEAKAAEWDLTDEQIEMIADDVSPLRRAEKWLKLTSYRVCARALRSALAEAGSGMPHTPAQEAREYRCRECDRWSPWTDGELAADNDGVALFWCQNCSAEMPLESMDSRLQEARGGAETSETGSGRGTGVREPHTRPQGSLPVEEGP